jgi:hypothetical protein
MPVDAAHDHGDQPDGMVGVLPQATVSPPVIVPEPPADPGMDRNGGSVKLKKIR